MKNSNFALIVAAAAALAACGGGGDDSAPDAGPSVTPGTLNTTSVPGAYTDPDRKYAFDTLNKVRGITGVGFLKQHPALDNAAQAHADYFRDKPGQYGHNEVPGAFGFTGATPADRARHFSYPFDAGEVAVGSANTMQSVFGLLGVPYHSLPMLASYSDLGVGISRNWMLVMELGKRDSQLLDSAFVAVYPCNNIQVNVQAQGYEEPLPSVLNGKQDFGYSSVALVRPGQKLEVTSWELKDASGNLVPTVLMTQANDKNGMVQANQASLIPLNALPRTVSSYTSVLKGKNNGVPFEKSCTWRTVVGETVPAN
ncbi:CAP domain-containing protein [Simplicispira suum]|uniref:CAP domain-containing protein n=1 Tax=Simplicispira suum TaxID=2109915 RepID=A0A2S0N2K7_9BURK|nr:CAP domain-containing protein [Simplicispira suum]AVO42356.1 CAP domain-containing protein [Simplicispira suum]